MTFRAGFVGLIGQPNAGKSSLMNKLVAERVSIVTAKPQTTRRRIIGIKSLPEGQVVFVDAPGIVAAKSGLNAFLMREAQDVIEQSDFLFVLVGLDTEKQEEVEAILKIAKESNKKWFLIISKVDLSKYLHRVTKIREMAAQLNGCVGIYEASTEWKSEDFQLLLQETVKQLPESPKPLYDIELYTNENVRDLVAEIVRERCFENLHHEIPYNLAVRVRKYEETPKIHRIFAEIIVAKENHKPIVIGKGGSVIKTIGTEARKQIEEIVGSKVHLELEVTVRPDWFDNKGIMKELGYQVAEND